MHSARTPSCPVSSPDGSSANFPSQFLAPKAVPTFTSDNRPTTDIFHLEYAGVHAITPSLVPVNLVRTSGVPALTGHCLVDMLPRDGVSSETEIFVANGYQSIPLSGSTDIQRSDLLGTPSSPLIQIPTWTLQDISTEPLPTSSQPAVSPQLNRPPRALAWVGSSQLPPQFRRHSPVPLHQLRFRRLPPSRTAYGRLGFSPGFSAIRGRHRRPAPNHWHRLTAFMPATVLSRPRRRRCIASQRPPPATALSTNSN